MPATANGGDVEGADTMSATVTEKPAAADKKNAQLNAEHFLFNCKFLQVLKRSERRPNREEKPARMPAV
jgi:hypothetical protein